MSDAPERFWAAGGKPRQIGDYGLISDCETAALVSRTGSIDWLCWPRFDSDACLCALLGDPANGFWRIAPHGAGGASSRRYWPDTLILETRFDTDAGSVLLIDLMPPRGHASDVVRIVRGLSGRVTVRSLLDLRFGYGRLKPLVRKRSDTELTALAGPDAVVLRSDHPLQVEESRAICDVTLGEGDSACFVLTYFPSHLPVPEVVNAAEALTLTEQFWTDWVRGCCYEGPHRDPVIRSLLTLKALTYRPTGGTVAAPTTSLPEYIGGDRNWDYRYCWLRDAAFMLLAFIHAGYPDEAAAWRDWLVRAVAGEPGNVKPLYRVDGGRWLNETVADWLSGFDGSGPVRLGNAAHQQIQIDVYGEVIDAFHLARRHGLEQEEESRRLQSSLLDILETKWREPDSGIWEVRSPPQHFVHSKALAWAAFDRGISDFAKLEDGDRVDRWRRAQAEIRDCIFTHGYSERLGAFTRAFGSDELDASTLLLPVVGFIDPMDPRALGTTRAIEERLVDRGFVLRYRSRDAADGLPPGEGAFLACSFWLADNYTMQGRSEDAEALFERLLGCTNDLGLLSEEVEPGSGRMLGNFPQALSHVGLVNTAFNLGAGRGPAEDRSDRS